MNKIVCILILIIGIIIPKVSFSSIFDKEDSSYARMSCVPYNILIFEEYDLVKAEKALVPTTKIEDTGADTTYTIYRCTNNLNGEICYLQLDGGLRVINCFER